MDEDPLELYNDQDYDIIILYDYGYVLLTVQKGSMCIEMIELIEDNVDLDETYETENHAAKCKYVLEKYKDNIKKIGYDFDDMTQYDYDIVTGIDLSNIIEKMI